MNRKTIGLAMCGSFCTFARVLDAFSALDREQYDLVPIQSQAAYSTDTRFGAAHDHMREMERICDRRVIDSIPKAEPIGPKHLLDVLLVCPCTGNTLAKLACGITDTTVTMAAKAHLRNGAPLVLAISTNDALAASAKHIGALMDKKNVYFVPFRQDDPVGKPTSLAADFSRVNAAIEAALQGRQLQPVVLGPDQ